MDFSQIATALGVISSVIGAIRWAINKSESILKSLIQAENAALSQKITLLQTQLSMIHAKSDELVKENKELRINIGSQKLFIGEISQDVKSALNEHGALLKKLEKSSAEWISADLVRIKGGPRE